MGSFWRVLLKLLRVAQSFSTRILSRLAMTKSIHEVRDPIHGFIRLDSQERKIVDSWPFQRLRHIHQLALTHLVYPGGTHKRFEHSLGVMELAARVFDVVTSQENLVDLSELTRRSIPAEEQRRYWRRVVRMAALCHDLGHLPFSHSAEAALLPEGWDHERLSIAIILSNEMRAIWTDMVPPLNPLHIAKVAVSPKKVKHLQGYGVEVAYSDWEALLAEITVGDAFGVDRIDYLLRDSHHAGVPFGHVDHFRLIDTLRILPRTAGDSKEPVLGIEEGGLHAAEALLLARYFMYIQLYMHPVRRIYDIHLKDFLEAWLPEGKFPTDVVEHTKLTDNEVLTEINRSANNPASATHELAKRLVRRGHFKEVYRRNVDDMGLNLDPGAAVFKALQERYDPSLVRRDTYTKSEKSPEFPVRARDGRVMSSYGLSVVLKQIPVVSIDSVFVHPSHSQDARDWLQRERENILRSAEQPKED